MKFENVHCLFEQSGTFKNEFINAGYLAYDYDILNEFNNTDFVCDLFTEIDNAYYDKKSIFDNISSNDLIMAFFPCTKFSCQAKLSITCNAYGMQKWNNFKKVLYSKSSHEELSNYYSILCKLVLIAYKRNFKMIIENPYNQPHYLTGYFPLKPDIIDYDRSLDGDYFGKPTQYFFINCSPGYCLLNDIIPGEKNNIERCKSINGKSKQVSRSLISPLYAKRFIHRYIIDGVYNNEF